MFKAVDYEQYYKNQVGGNVKDYFQGLKFQDGYGYLGRIFNRYAVPALKYLGNEALKTGVSFISDVSRGEQPKNALKTQLKKRGVSILNKLINKIEPMNQSGSGRKRRLRLVKREKSKRIRKKRRKSKKKSKKIPKNSKILKRREKSTKKVSKGQRKSKSRTKLDFFNQI